MRQTDGWTDPHTENFIEMRGRIKKVGDTQAHTQRTPTHWQLYKFHRGQNTVAPLHGLRQGSYWGLGGLDFIS